VKVELWSKSSQLAQPPVEALKLWEGDLPCPPRAGDFIIPFVGFAARLVEEVHWHTNAGEVEVDIYIGPDYTGEYAEELAEKEQT
jgi:hypothetical protein